MIRNIKGERKLTKFENLYAFPFYNWPVVKYVKMKPHIFGKIFLKKDL